MLFHLFTTSCIIIFADVEELVRRFVYLGSRWAQILRKGSLFVI